MKEIELKWIEQLPWPQVWTAMSWEIACWVGNQPMIGGVKVVWNEELLKQQVSTKKFFALTTELRSALEGHLADRFEWQVTPNGAEKKHQLFLYSSVSAGRIFE